MDALSRISREHGQVYEALTVFKKLIEVESDQASFMKMREFFRDLVVPHFKFEEDQLFPIMLKYGVSEEKAVTEELLKEHAGIMEAFAKFSAAFDIVVDGDFEGNPALKAMTTGIAKMLLDHTHKEDKSFYPNLKRYLLRPQK